MGQLNVEIPDELDEKFKRVVAKKFGLRKGSLKKAIEEAIMEWIKRNE